MSATTEHMRRNLAGLAIGLAFGAPCSANGVDWSDLKPVSDARLANLRGGFETSTGLKLSFSMERVVYINGELTATTRLSIPDLANLSGRGASLTSTGTGALPAGSSLPLPGPSQLITNGQVIQLPSTTAMITGIQNSLNNQMIQVRTTIDATLPSMSQFRSQLFSDAFRSSTINSTRR